MEYQLDAHGYMYDVFISYKRHGDWTDWVNSKFLPLLENHLSFELGYPARIFVDTSMSEGADWPKTLANNLHHSKVLIPLFSKMYFSSNWCLRELFAMYYKEEQLCLRTLAQPQGIIVPAKIHDGEDTDLLGHLIEIGRNQALDLKLFALTSIRKGGPRYEKFEIAVKGWVQRSVAPAINRVEVIKPEWLEVIEQGTYHRPEPVKYLSLLPSLG